MPGRRAPEEQRREEIIRAAFAVAARDRLGGVTARAVAAEARLSSGLVFFYFETVDALLVALLDWLLARTIVVSGRPRPAEVGAPADRMMAAIRRDVEWLPQQRERVELFFDYWVLGTRHPAIRRKIRRALDRYRASFVLLAADVVSADAERYADITADGLAAVAAGFVEGCALQIVMDPSQFDVERSMATLTALVRHTVNVAG